ncbi:hypothetical protein BXZ70DRAFT_915537 [Cristinia sonorae]|uniref:Protein kinase domain-containing protein n=1 Tax=Cristinia sonorae TaxID=1940300 RepID=A0A8K0UWT7_9AGAR|nr:hypothetical protein BXZ70DRAFT_915537 [Cristinia sonorae]
MAQQRTNHRSSSAHHSPIHQHRKLAARRVASGGRRRVFTTSSIFPPSRASIASSASSSPPTSSRAALVPLHFNLRRLPSRIFSDRTEAMHDAVEIGSKRKRVVSGSENVQSNGRDHSAGGRVKRRRAAQDSSDEEMNSMDVDEQSRWDVIDSSGSDGASESSTTFLLNEAGPRQLLRLRKDELVRLYQIAGLTEDAELLTKHEIVDSLVDARDEVAPLPPSSPPGPMDSGSSDYSSDGGNVAGGEETDIGYRLRNGMRRRATVHDMSRVVTRPGQERHFSLGDLDGHQLKTRISPQRKASLQHAGQRRGASNASSSRSSPTTSLASSSLPSPPATRTRSRKTSADYSAAPAVPSASVKGKGKAKQVEFSEDVQVQSVSAGEESDLTDLTEVEERLLPTTPSPRRLRSKGERDDHLNGRHHDEDLQRRVTPARKAKKQMGSLKESSSEEEEEDQLAEESDMDEGGEADDAGMVTPKPNRRTPLRKRLRSRGHLLTPPSDGDDEDSDEESVDITQSVDGDDEVDEEEEDAGSEEGTVVDDGEQEEEEEEEMPLSQPRTLRNGKVVGEEMQEDASDEDQKEGSLVDQDAASVDLDAEGDTEEEEEEEEEAMEDDVDLTVVTAKTLVRMRRDDLVRLCESRELDVNGTKPQLAEALLQWRDRHCSEISSSPSSTGTARPPSTARPRRRNTRSGGNSPPVLLRSNRVHLDEPRTPPLSTHNKDAAEPEFELDLSSLGLDDREIPPEKITKLEKIGSGGFKDVFVGKFKGRRVAIAEFRGQLSNMDIKELKLLGDFNHPNIVRFLGVSIPENTRETPVMIVSELCSNGDLFDYIRNVAPPTLYRALSMMLDIARGIAYLHNLKPPVIHRDCKSSNILITSKGVAKITDFGLAKVKQSTRSMMRSLVGTVNWQAPELWHAAPKYNHKVDTFSCGLVFWEILQWHNPSKKFPWEGMNEHAIYDIVGAKRQRPSVAGLRKQWCPEIVDLIERMWKHDHHDRPEMNEVVEILEELVQKYR